MKEETILIPSIISKQRDFFATGKTKNIDFRLSSLKKLKSVIKKNEQVIFDALHYDLGKHKVESFMTEIGIIYDEINHAVKHLKKWATVKKVRTNLANIPGTSEIHKEPFGVCLIMAPWNYPFNLLFAPLVGALGAGNCAILKTGHASSKTSDVIKEIIEDTFESSHVACFGGGREVISSLLKERYDYIFFTGGTTLGKIVMRSAAENLTPLTLELGGKSPCVVTKNAKIKLAAKRIAWAKCLNSGQTCLAPDYLLIENSVKEEFIEEFKRNVVLFFGKNPKESEYYPRIISESHFDKVFSFLTGGNVVFGGEADKATKYISPTILENVDLKHPVMTEEIFGPILPVIPFDNLSKAIDFINEREKPLALYVYTEKAKEANRFIEEVSFGGGCVNDCIVHVANSNIPFGGVGLSGMGLYHGEASFNTFSNTKGILRKSTMLDIPLRYAPYTDKVMKMLRVVFR